MSSTKPCYSPMLAGQTLYRDSSERNRKKQCFFTIYAFLLNPSLQAWSQRPLNFCCKPSNLSSRLSVLRGSLFSLSACFTGS